MVRHTDPWVPCAQLQVSVWLLEQARNLLGRLDAMEATMRTLASTVERPSA
jgi:hypothetical protein